MNILLSSGHHPVSPGACFNGFCEHDEAVMWVKEIYQHIYMHTDRVIVVPPMTLKNKVLFINVRSPLFAIEIHFNSDNTHSGKGSEALYYPGSEKGKELAIKFQTVIGEICIPDRGVKEGYYRMDKSKGADYFLERTKCPSIILEPEFVHNKDKIRSLRNIVCKNIAEILLGELVCQ